MDSNTLSAMEQGPPRWRSPAVPLESEGLWPAAVWQGLKRTRCVHETQERWIRTWPDGVPQSKARCCIDLREPTQVALTDPYMIQHADTQEEEHADTKEEEYVDTVLEVSSTVLEVSSQETVLDESSRETFETPHKADFSYAEEVAIEKPLHVDTAVHSFAEEVAKIEHMYTDVEHSGVKFPDGDAKSKWKITCAEKAAEESPTKKKKTTESPSKPPGSALSEALRRKVTALASQSASSSKS